MLDRNPNDEWAMEIGVQVLPFLNKFATDFIKENLA